MERLTTPPIAIVGIAAELPGSGGDLGRLAELLDSGADLVAPVPPARRADAGLSPDTELSEAALLDRVDGFDHAFFGLSLREARQMDPQQRLLLQLACQAVWDAGYPLSRLRGSRTAVVLGAARETYSELIDPATAPLVTGLLPAAQAGRLAHALDLRGPAVTVDSACSSALLAVHEACRRLAAGEIDLALTGGVRVLSTPPAATLAGSESIVSPRGRSRSFDEQADGTGLGEGGAVFLLKPLARAEADGDPIHAVILGGAANHDGGRSNGFAAPSADAQEELLLEAWQAAGIHPHSVGFVEAHGTGTRLGDPIEFQALSAAFARRTDRTGFCVLSSVKSNLGHLDSAAGAAGLTKAVVALKTGRRYPSAHFTSPNPLLETAASALLLSPRTEPWDSSTQRRAGVSAFGLTGTNVHLVLEEAPARPGSPAADGATRLLVPVAARSAGALRSQARRLATHLRTTTGPGVLADLAQTQAVGRDHERWRGAVLAATAQEAAEALERLAGQAPAEPVPDAVALITLLPHEGSADERTIRQWLAAFPGLADWQAKQRAALDGATSAELDAAEQLLGKLTVVRALLDAGLSDRILIGHGSGNLLVDLLRGESDLLAAVRALPAPGTVAAPDPTRTEAALVHISATGDPVLLAAWPGALSTVAGDLAARHRGVLVQAPVADRAPREALLETLAALYRAGADIDWARCTTFLGGYGRRASVPTDLFEPVRCWVEPRTAVTTSVAAPTGAAPALPSPAHLAESDGTVAELRLAAIWCDLLETETVGRDDDFFDLGGDSLMQVQLANAVARDFGGLDLDFDVVFEHPTLGDLAAHLAEVAPVGAAAPAEAGPRHDPDRTTAPATHSQRRMWLLQQLAPDSGAYNVSTAFELAGPVGPEAVRAALDGLVARHGLLRTALVLEDGELIQRVAPAGRFDLTVRGWSGTAESAAAELRADAARPFDLAQPGAARALLLTDDADPTRAWFQLVLHHAICDEWSMNLLLDELTDGAHRPAPELQFADWAAWERGLDATPGYAEDGEYWRRTLAGAPAELPLPTDVPHGAQQDYRGSWLEVSVPAATVARMRESARSRNGTLFTWLMTGYAAWLARLTQAEDFVVGVPVAGRHRAEAEQLPGCFINTLPVRIDASGDPSFETLFDRVRAALTSAFSHQRYPFDAMVDELGVARDAARPPLVQTVLSLQSGGEETGTARRRLAGATIRPLQVDGTASWFDVSSVLWESDGGLSGIFAYRTALFEEETVRGFRDDWTALAEAGLDKPGHSIHTLLDDDAW